MSLSRLVNDVVNFMLQVLFLFLEFLVEIVKALSLHTKSVNLFTQCPVRLQKLPKLAVNLTDTHLASNHNSCRCANDQTDSKVINPRGCVH